MKKDSLEELLWYMGAVIRSAEFICDCVKGLESHRALVLEKAIKEYREKADKIIPKLKEAIK